MRVALSPCIENVARADQEGPDTIVGDDEVALLVRDRIELQHGEVVGRYVLLQRVGSGGMGVVYAAYDPELDRRIALKVLRGRDYGGPRIQTSRHLSDQFREAQAMAKLSHPNVVTVHDVGRFGDNIFIAMEFIEGVSLRRWLAQSKRSCAQVLDVFARAGRGLAAAHAVGLVHHDFKPDNVLVGHDGRVVVMDFGLARQLDPEGASAQTHPLGIETLPDVETVDEHAPARIAGTPAYMAPEQHGRVKVSAAADQFSFCVALYEALFSQHPFEGLSPVSLCTAMLAGDRRAEPQDPPRVPRKVRRAIERGLERDPAARFPSMRALLAQLRPGPSRLVSWRLGLVGSCALLGIVGSLGLWALVPKGSTTPETTPVDACANLERPAPTPPARLDTARPVVEDAVAMRLRAETLLNAGRLDEGHTLATKAMDLALTANDPPSVAKARAVLSSSYALRGRFQRAEALALQTLADLRRAHDPELEAIVWVRWLELVAIDQGRPAEAERWVPIAHAALDRLGRPPALLVRLERIRKAIDRRRL